MTKDEKLKALLGEYCSILNLSVKTLEASEKRCAVIEVKSPDISMEDSDALDAMTSKFARSADLYTQKLLTTILQIKRSTMPTFVDKMNLCEKVGIIHSALDMIKICDLRNEIAHEYWLDQIREQQEQTLKYISVLISNIEDTKSYLKSENLL